MISYKKSIQKILFYSLIFFCCYSCGDKEEEITPEAYIDLPNGEISSKGGSFFLHLTTAGSWQVEIEEDWCTFNKTEGEGSIALIGKVELNVEEGRETIITVTFGNGVVKVLTLKQRGAGEVPYFEYAGRLEIPELTPGSENLVFSHSTTYQGKNTITLSMEYDCSKKHSRWIAFTFYDATSKKNTSRSDEWGDDPKVPVEYRTKQSDFKGYTRGHLCASADRLYSREANVQTFYYSNMSPQSYSFNTGAWLTMEGNVQTWGKDASFRDTLYVVKGGTIDDDKILGYNGSGLAIPRYYFMALLRVKNGEYYSIGLFFEHLNVNKVTTLSIKELEEKTGINFFHNLPDEIEDKVERQYNPNGWPGL